MRIEHFLVTNRDNQAFKQRIEQAQKTCLEGGTAISKPALIAGHIILAARDNLLSLHNETSVTNDEVEAQKVANVAAVFMGELIRTNEKIGTNEFSTGELIGKVNRVLSGTGVDLLPPPTKPVKLKEEEWHTFVRVSREDQTGASFLKNIANLPQDLQQYIMTYKQVENLYMYILKYGLLDDYQDLAREVIYESVKLGPDAPFSSSKKFDTGMKKKVRAFFKTYEGRKEERVEPPPRVREAPPARRDTEEFETDYQERRDAADLAEEFLKKGTVPGDSIPDDEVLVQYLIGGRKILSEAQQKKLDRQALKRTVNGALLLEPISVVNIEEADTNADRNAKLSKTPSYFGVVHEEDIEKDLAQVDSEKKKLIGDVAVNLIQTAKHNNWGESARKIAKKARKEMNNRKRKKNQEEEREDTLDLEDDAEREMVMYRLSRATGTTHILTHGEELPIKKGHVTRLKKAHFVPGIEEKVHLGYIDGQELWYKEPRRDNIDVKSRLEKRAVDQHDALVRQSQEELPDPDNPEGMDGLMHKLFRVGRIEPLFSERDEEKAQRYLARIRTLMQSSTLGQGQASKDPLESLVEMIAFRDATVDKLIAYLKEMGRGEEGEKARDEGSKVPSDALLPHQERYRTMIERIADYNRLINLGGVGIGEDQMDTALKGLKEKTKQLSEKLTEKRKQDFLT